MKLAQIVWQGVSVSLMYREVFSSVIEFTDNHDFVNFLSDARKQGAVSPEDRKWFQNTIVPQATKQGLRYGAVVIKKGPFKKYYMNMILKWLNRKSKIDMKIFYDYDEAKNWLKEKSGL